MFKVLETQHTQKYLLEVFLITRLIKLSMTTFNNSEKLKKLL
jgi:hypothetical protein